MNVVSAPPPTNHPLRAKPGVVPENAPVITYEPGTEQMLVPGAHVIISASKAADGALTAMRVSVGKDGLVPPM